MIRRNGIIKKLEEKIHQYYSLSGNSLTIENGRYFCTGKLKIYGNMALNGTQSPLSPANLDFCGNLVEDTTSVYYDKYAVKVISQGKNLFNVVDAVDTENWTRQNDQYYNNLVFKAGKTYTISFLINSLISYNYLAYYSCCTVDTRAHQFVVFNVSTMTENMVGTKYVKTITFQKDCNLTIYKPNYASSEVLQNYFYDVFSNWQVEEGRLQTEYQPFNHDEAVIYLNEPLRKVGSVADCLDLEKGKVIRKIGKVTINGSENGWSQEVMENGKRFILSFSGISTDNSSAVKAISNSYVETTYLDTATTGNKIAVTPNSDGLCFRNTDYDNSTLENFKTYLSQNPVTVYYILEQETFETIDKQPVKYYNGKTTISVDTSVLPSIMELLYRN